MSEEEQKGYIISPSKPNLRIYESDQIVIKEGEPDDGNIYILNSGKLAVILNNKKVAEITNPGVFVGEMSTILQSPRSTTIKTLEESQFTVYTGELEKVVEELPSVAIKIMIQLATRLKNTTALQAEAEANNADLKKEFDTLQQKLEQLQQDKPKKRKRNLFRR